MFRLCGRSRPDLTMDGCMLTQRYQMQGFRELRKIRRLLFSFFFFFFFTFTNGTMDVLRIAMDSRECVWPGNLKERHGMI